MSNPMTNPLPTFGAPPASGSYYNQVSSGHGWFVQTIPAHQYRYVGNWWFEGDGPLPETRPDNDLLQWRPQDKTVIYWYCGRVTGEPRFMFATGEAGAELDLFEVVGGTVKNPAAGVETLVGKCRFTGDIFAFRFYKFGNDGEIISSIRSGIRVELVMLSETSAIYYYKPRRGEGIIAQFFHNAKGEQACAVGFWTYRPNAIGVRHTDTWYAFEGESVDGVHYILYAYETTGAFQTADLKTKNVGAGTLTVIDGNTVRFTFTIGNRSERYNMEKLA